MSGFPLEAAPDKGSRRGAKLGLIAGPVLCAILLALPAPASMAPEAWHVLAVAVLMAVWWTTEALPLPATALIPLVLFPLTGIAGIRQAAAPFADPAIFLFVGGFMIALAMQRWDLHRRVALTIVARIGTHPAALVPGFMVATAFLSMWVSNTATTMMMMPIAASVAGVILAEAKGDNPHDQHNFVVALMLGICYSASIGGLSTLIGTPPNAFLKGYLARTTGLDIGFATWLGFGLPVALAMLPAAWWVLTRIANPFRLAPSPEVSNHVRQELAAMGPMTAAEKGVAVIFGVAAGLWIFRQLLAKLPGLGGISDTGIAIFCALLLFILPSAGRGSPRLMNWQATRDLPWGILILIGGGLSLAAAIADSGLATAIGSSLTGLQGWPLWVLTLTVVALVIFMTELTSNTATTAAFLPVVGGLAVVLGLVPLALAAPAAVAASCAFMLPVATAPNAIIYGSGYVTIGQMMRAGLILNLIGMVLITALALLLVPILVG